MDFLKARSLWCFILWILIPSEILFGQSFGVGYVKYQKGDFAGAEVAFTQALKTAQGASERAKILEYLGISQFFRGNVTAAKASFKEALAWVPGLTIDPNDVLDESVIETFDMVKRAGPYDPSNANNRSSQAQGGGGDRATKQTLLKVVSTPADSQISIDGIIAGRGGELINTDPGTVTLTISAPGYESKVLTVIITANRENLVKASLEKIKPKAKPLARPKDPSLASSPSAATSASPRPANTRPGGKKTPASSAVQAPAPGTPDLASQFEMDAAAARQPPPNHPYAGYGAPGYGASPYGPAGYYPAYPYGPGGSPRYRYRYEEPNYLILALPFGVGQFYQDREVAGLFFLVAEGFGIYTITKALSGIQSSTRAEAKFRAEYCTDPKRPPENDAKCAEDSANQKTFRSKTFTSITAASLGVFALMLYGAGDAIIKDPDYQIQPPAKRPRRSADARDPDSIRTVFAEHAPKPSSWHWHLALTPASAYDGASSERMGTTLEQPVHADAKSPGFLWDVEWTF